MTIVDSFQEKRRLKTCHCKSRALVFKKRRLKTGFRTIVIHIMCSNLTIEDALNETQN